MEKNSQTSLYVIIGLIVVTVISIVYFTVRETTTQEFKLNTESTLSFAETKTLITTYVTSCADNVVRELIEETGIREETLPEYESLIGDKLQECVSSLFDRLKEQNYMITENTPIIEAEINDETIIVNIGYEIIIERGDNKIQLDTFFITFDRSVNQHIDNGITDDEVVFKSTDGRATITIPPGVEITDQDGNPVENIGIRVEDLHFEGLNNGAVIGNLVFEAFPDGVKFSQPVELMIEFRQSDLPEGMNLEQVSIAWWDPELQIWRGLPTVVMNNVAITKTTHFSYYSTTLCSSDSGGGTTTIAPTNNPSGEDYEREFNQRYSLCKQIEKGPSECGCEDEIPLWDDNDDIIKPVALYAKNGKGEYYDYLDHTTEYPYLSYGYYPGASPKDCMENTEDPDWVDDQDDFVILFREWENKGCSYSDISEFNHGNCGDEIDDSFFLQCRRLACNSKNPGEFCNIEYINSLGDKIEYDGQCYNDCICSPKLDDEEDKFGYPDARCVGGIADAGDNAIKVLSFPREGDSCIASGENFDTTVRLAVSVSLDDCSEETQIPEEIDYMLPDDFNSGRMIDVNFCYFIKYPGEIKNFRIVPAGDDKSLTGNTEAQVRGVKVVNYRDSEEGYDGCAYAGIVWTVKAYSSPTAEGAPSPGYEAKILRFEEMY